MIELLWPPCQFILPPSSSIPLFPIFFVHCSYCPLLVSVIPLLSHILHSCPLFSSSLTPWSSSFFTLVSSILFYVVLCFIYVQSYVLACCICIWSYILVFFLYSILCSSSFSVFDSMFFAFSRFDPMLSFLSFSVLDPIFLLSLCSRSNVFSRFLYWILYSSFYSVFDLCSSMFFLYSILYSSLFFLYSILCSSLFFCIRSFNFPCFSCRFWWLPPWECPSFLVLRSVAVTHHISFSWILLFPYFLLVVIVSFFIPLISGRLSVD